MPSGETYYKQGYINCIPNRLTGPGVTFPAHHQATARYTQPGVEDVALLNSRSRTSKTTPGTTCLRLLAALLSDFMAGLQEGREERRT
ncbi:hypothetical protein PoB_003095900 [Plakobranchus ocellatus]|uniref:Uncharacterized protein n=1 Tax=Plakobranchus ocellatus TaxID=259542 RepID=A0AAV4ADX8_9GAST|nr:hypothetical protein PoB_003095900 [Plakobranchus ocellatus]